MELTDTVTHPRRLQSAAAPEGVSYQYQLELPLAASFASLCIPLEAFRPARRGQPAPEAALLRASEVCGLGTTGARDPVLDVPCPRQADGGLQSISASQFLGFRVWVTHEWKSSAQALQHFLLRSSPKQPLGLKAQRQSPYTEFLRCLAKHVLHISASRKTRPCWEVHVFRHSYLGNFA